MSSEWNEYVPYEWNPWKGEAWWKLIFITTVLPYILIWWFWQFLVSIVDDFKENSRERTLARKREANPHRYTLEALLVKKHQLEGLTQTNSVKKALESVNRFIAIYADDAPPQSTLNLDPDAAAATVLRQVEEIVGLTGSVSDTREVIQKLSQ